MGGLRRSASAVTALWIGLIGVAAWAAPCQMPTSTWQAWHIDEGDISIGQVLLGADGSRVTVGADLIEAPVLQAGSMRSSGTWLDRVDWSVYHDPDRTGTASAVVHVERDAQGQARACRLERRGPTEAFEARRAARPGARPGPSDMQVLSQETLGYDAQGRIISMTRTEAEPGTGRLQATRALCLRHDAEGRVTAFIERSQRHCQAPPHASDLSRWHVHAKQGPLLRSITRELRMEASPSTGVFDFVPHPVVTLHGADGQPQARYEEDASHRPYRLPVGRLTDKDHRPSTIWIIEGAQGLALRITDAGQALAGTDWLIAKAPVDGEDLLRYTYGDEHRLAKGRTDSRGSVRMSADERQKVWQAMQAPGQVVVFAHGSGSTVLLAPALPAARWRACQVPAQASCP